MGVATVKPGMLQKAAAAAAAAAANTMDAGFGFGTTTSARTSKVSVSKFVDLRKPKYEVDAPVIERVQVGWWVSG